MIKCYKDFKKYIGKPLGDLLEDLPRCFVETGMNLGAGYHWVRRNGSEERIIIYWETSPEKYQIITSIGLWY